MAGGSHSLEIAPSDREAFVLYLALGTLEAMRDGSWPLEAGIWTLGLPAFWQPLVGSGGGAVKLLGALNELSVLRNSADGRSRSRRSTA